jgi:MFS transporter, FHS family, L-fucose permease
MGKLFGQRSALKTANDQVTNAAQLTLRASIYPLLLVTSLFFLWVIFTRLPVVAPADR